MSSTTISRWHERLQFKISVLLVALVTLVMSAFCVYDATIKSEVLDQGLNNLILNVGDRASKALALALWEFNQDQGVEAIIAEMDDERVQSIVLQDSYGEVFAARMRDTSGEVVDPDETLKAEIEADVEGIESGVIVSKELIRSTVLNVMHDDEVIGLLMVQVNEKQMVEDLKAFYIERLWQTLILVVITTAVMLIACKYLLISPLLKLTHAAMELSEGDLEIAFAVKSRDEVGQLGRALEVFRQNAVEKEKLQEQRDFELIEKEKQERENLRISEQRQAAEERLRVEQQEAASRELERSRDMQLRVDELLSTVDSVASGDLLAPITVKGDDAIGRIGERLEHVFHQFAHSIQDIGTHASTLGAASESMTAVSETIAGSAQNNSDKAIEVSEASDEISSGVDNVAAAIIEMSATVKEIAKNADQATAVAKEANTLTTDASNLVSNLASSSADIGNVIKVITSIAEQTNLLALNATIEAARAGDAGKGFAVVANEVKELAKETANATDDISDRIQTIQNDSGSVTQSISSISSIIDRINDLQSTIAVSVDEQALASSEISRIVSHTATGSQSIASSMNQIADSASESLTGANMAREASKEMRNMASELRALVSQFKVDDSH